MAFNSYPKKKPMGVTYDQIVREVRAGNVKPIYYLMGAESYYIDRVADFIADSVLKPEERDFGLITVFGADTDIGRIMAAAQSFPMGCERQVILVKEAQVLKNIEKLENYLQHIQPSTVLIFCHKNGTIDRRLKIASLIEKVGVLFESKKVYDRGLVSFVQAYLKRKRIAFEPGVAEMMAESVGSDLNRLAGELEKLILSMPVGAKMVTCSMVHAHIGVSKNFNVFELQDALGKKDVVKVNQIAKYFDDNPKENPLELVLPSLFRFFSNIMLAYYSPDKSERGIAQWLGGMTEWQVRQNVLPGMRVYSGVKVMQILSVIRRTDARSKGLGNPFISRGDLMKELLFFILH